MSFHCQQYQGGQCFDAEWVYPSWFENRQSNIYLNMNASRVLEDIEDNLALLSK